MAATTVFSQKVEDLTTLYVQCNHPSSSGGLILIPEQIEFNYVKHCINVVLYAGSILNV